MCIIFYWDKSCNNQCFECFPSIYDPQHSPISTPLQFIYHHSNHQNLSKSLTHELVVKADINYFRQITTEHADFVTTINSLNIISYLCAIIKTIHFLPPMQCLHLVNGWMYEFCFIHQLVLLDYLFDVFACQTSLVTNDVLFCSRSS